MPRVRVLVVEDSLTVRKRLCEILGNDPEIDVVGEAEDGKRAIELCAQLRPDVITLDMMLPLMSGLAATEYIMAHCPTPILIVSASINRGEIFKTLEALSAGAVDVLEKPRADEVEGAWERQFTSTVKLVARIRVITHPRGRLGPLGRATVPVARSANPTESNQACRIVALGASTGGPGALADVLRTITVELTVPVFVVLHISEPFGAAFADWLDGQSMHRVSYARDGELVNAIGGRVVMAPPGWHLVCGDGRLHLSSAPERHSCRPSIDVLFESLAREHRDGVLGCLLTGMGQDGAAGLLAIRDAGGRTIAQDEATSVVYGMPREAARIGAVQRVLPLGEIGPAITEIIVRRRQGPT